MKNKLFVIAYVYYEEYSPYYFYGPSNVTQENFQKLCDSLLEEAGYKAIAHERGTEYISWVGWREVVEAMIPLLEKQGYHHFKPKIVEYFGPGIIDNDREYGVQKLGKAGKAVINYNYQRRGG